MACDSEYMHRLVEDLCIEINKAPGIELDQLIMALTDDMLKQSYSGSCDDGMLYAAVVKYAAYIRKAKD